MDEIEIRRLHISDEQWIRTSPSWKSLKPERNFNEIDLSDETVREYRQRLLPEFDIPLEVLDQWLFGLYYDSDTVDNYGWIDYAKCEFSLEDVDLATVTACRAIEDFGDFVGRRENLGAYDEFMCTPTDLDHWKEAHTWRVPPVMLDVTTLPEIPEYSDIVGPLQLVEGHSRLGYLLSVLRCDKPLLEMHKVYILRYSGA